MKRTPLARGTKPLIRRAELPRTGRLALRSPKRVLDDRERTRQRREAEYRGEVVCQVAHLLLGECWGPIDWNERLTRARGGSITDPANRLWCCRQHHSYLHAHPSEAEELGLMLPSSY